MSEDTLFSTHDVDPEDEPETTGDEMLEAGITPPPLPQDDAVVPPPLPVDAIEVEPAAAVITPSTPVEVAVPAAAAAEAVAWEAVDVPSPFEDVEEPGVVTPQVISPEPITPAAFTAEPVSGDGTVIGDPPKKKNNTVLIIVIVVAVLLLLCCCCIIVLTAIGSEPFNDMMREFENMWLGGLSLPALR